MKLLTLTTPLLLAALAQAAAMVTPADSLIAKDQHLEARADMCGNFCVGPGYCHGKCSKCTNNVCKQALN
ncbi:uncharacterized protein BP01DRAFT_378840 [Aspergillus saccharolyticus JOP 1030-1]|uniref:Uncharacterized protein n=1 Tax=Aspergillus saccharolyticus JOP 1030-1 TaxID=1450539 RepID=A0A318ZY83_9EURO|nr:hypothetical protein BP01DRAFT_378840 [Aspergillus saccharolyticus JOP 1030-1]PYH49273.1 hypothetical protein BP01DRAFT_378840 [Aspergillus saccharolyticus JOP 1030-1]